MKTKAKMKKLKLQIKQQPITLTHSKIEKIKMDATDNALSILTVFSMMALRDEFGFGKKRLEKFYKKFFDLNESFKLGYITLNDIVDTLEQETGIKFDSMRNDLTS